MVELEELEGVEGVEVEVEAKLLELEEREPLGELQEQPLHVKGEDTGSNNSRQMPVLVEEQEQGLAQALVVVVVVVVVGVVGEEELELGLGLGQHVAADTE